MAKAKELVIVESPSKAKTIEKYLGGNYKVTASMGHLRDLPKSKLGVDLEHGFQPEYIPVKDKKDLIDELKKESKKAPVVYLATDPDREGEAISWHLKELLGLSDEKAKRVTFNEITKKVVTESIQHPRGIDQDLVDAQQARRVLDRLVGYQISPPVGGDAHGGGPRRGDPRFPERGILAAGCLPEEESGRKQLPRPFLRHRGKEDGAA